MERMKNEVKTKDLAEKRLRGPSYLTSRAIEDTYTGVSEPQTGRDVT